MDRRNWKSIGFLNHYINFNKVMQVESGEAEFAVPGIYHGDGVHKVGH